MFSSCGLYSYQKPYDIFLFLNRAVCRLVEYSYHKEIIPIETPISRSLQTDYICIGQPCVVVTGDEFNLFTERPRCWYDLNCEPLKCLSKRVVPIRYYGSV